MSNIIKVNLLPKNINMKEAKKRLAIAMTALVLVYSLALGGYIYKLGQDVAAMEDLAARTEEWETRVKGIQQKKADVMAAIAPKQKRLDFINKVLDYNQAYPKLYQDIARWTYEKVAYSGMECDGKNMSINAHCKTLDDLGRYLLNMYRATDLFTEVKISDIPGYPMAQQQTGTGVPKSLGEGSAMSGGSQAGLAGLGAISAGVERVQPEVSGIDFSVSCVLKKEIVVPTFDGAPAAQPGY